LANPDVASHLATVGPVPLIEQVAPADPDIFGVAVAAHLTIPITGDITGALALGHTVGRARGFTSLCQRIGRALADAAEPPISHASAREALATGRRLLD